MFGCTSCGSSSCGAAAVSTCHLKELWLPSCCSRMAAAGSTAERISPKQGKSKWNPCKLAFYFINI